MSREFLQSLELDESVYTAGNLIVVHENGRIDASFVEHFIVGDFFRRYGENAQVILVLTVQSQAHWAAIASRIGWNFNTFLEKGQVIVLDLLKDAYINLTQSDPESGETANHPEKVPAIVSSSNKVNPQGLGELFEKIENICKVSSQNSSGKKLNKLLVIEDLSALLYTCQEETKSEKMTTEFLCKLKSLATSDGSVLLSFVSSEDSVDLVGLRFSKLVAQTLAEVSIQVSPLSTGFSPQISGYLTVASKLNPKVKWIKSNHYKLDDRNIKITPL